MLLQFGYLFPNIGKEQFESDLHCEGLHIFVAVNVPDF